MIEPNQPPDGPYQSGYDHCVTSQAVPTRSRANKAAQRWRHRALVVEGMGLLALGTALQKWVPMTKWSRLLGEAGPVPDQWSGAVIRALPARAADVWERRVVVALRSADAHVPWHNTCLAEAVAAQVLLRQLGRPGVVVIGLRVSEVGPWDAHAWLLGPRGALTGGPAARGFTATTVFEVPGGLRSSDIDLELPDGKTWAGPLEEDGTGEAVTSLTAMVGSPATDTGAAGVGDEHPAIPHPGLHRVAGANDADSATRGAIGLPARTSS